MTTANNNLHYVGKVVRAVSARCEEKFTSPPERYTEDSLVADMLNAHKFAKSEQERAVLKETEGLGTSRTREPTITNLIRRGMLVSKKKGKRYEVTSSSSARSFVGMLPGALTEVGTTAKWEVAFKMVERGKATPEQIHAHLTASLNHLMSLAKQSKGKIASPGGNSDPKLASLGRVTDVKSVFANRLPPGTKTPTASTAGGSTKRWI